MIRPRRLVIVGQPTYQKLAFGMDATQVIQYLPFEQVTSESRRGTEAPTKCGSVVEVSASQRSHQLCELPNTAARDPKPNARELQPGNLRETVSYWLGIFEKSDGGH